MIKEIQYQGYTTEPSDYECSDGQLATSLNLINEDNQLKPVFQPSEQCQLANTDKIVYIHETSAYTHYIVQRSAGNTLLWFDASVVTEAVTKPVPVETINTELAKTNPSHTLYSFSNKTIYSVNGIGNTLVILTSDGMHYFLWKGTNDGYLYLGTHLPELPLSFGLQGEMVRTDTFTIHFDGWTQDSERLYDEFSDNNKSRVSDQVLAKVNKFIADNSTNAGRFIFPFFVRYAYRLYDGSLTMHSAPILMVCSSDITPVVIWESINNEGSGDYSEAIMRVFGMRHQLDYAVCLASRITMLQNWKDIVRSVDIFISKPIYTYDQNGKCKRFARTREKNSFSICKHINQAVSTETYPLRYQCHTFNKLYSFTYRADAPGWYADGCVELPARSTDQVKADIRSTSNFYLLKSLKIDELTTERTIIGIEEDYLQSLVNREVMTDDYDSHDTLMPQYSFPYNQRLNIANIRKKLYDTFNAGAMFCYTDGYVMNFSDSSPTILDRKVSISVLIYIKHDGRDIIVQGEGYAFGLMSRTLFIYYPNANAYKAIILTWDYFQNGVEVPLETHGYLNGAYYFGGWDNPTSSANIPSESSNADKVIDVPSKIYTSEVNNPFVFPVTGINTVGTGTILGISAAAKALSQGQFGQFPLYAFTTEGVWALEVSSTGTYSARQPITRDVCINADSITQLDSAVLFATDRGIMLISGSQTQCITDSIFAEHPFNVLDLPSVARLHTMIGHSTDTCLPVQPFLTFIKDCQMVYDYVHQRVFVFNTAYSYAYVYSLKSQRWGMTFSKLSSPINSYPDALAMTSDHMLVSYSETDDEECKGLYITRPLKLEAADVHKTISTIIQRGHFQRGDVATVLYGSRDLYNWHLIWSSTDHFLRGFRGTPYKYFRIAGVATLTDGKSIFGASVNMEPRHTNQLR